MSGAPLWMPLHVSDYIRDTRHLSTAEHGAYLLLMMHAWTNVGELPTDEKRLARIAGLNPREWNKSRETLLDFFTLEGGMYRQKRIDHELKKADHLIEQKREAGKASARARAQRALNGCSTGVPTADPTDGQRGANQSQSQGSSSKEEGAGAPQDALKEIFSKGVSLLVAAEDCNPKGARSLIAKWRKDHGADAVIAAIRDADRLAITGPKAWISKRLNNAASGTSQLYASIDRTFGASPVGEMQ